jgi:hypothetical protein
MRVHKLARPLSVDERVAVQRADATGVAMSAAAPSRDWTITKPHAWSVSWMQSHSGCHGAGESSCCQVSQAAICASMQLGIGCTSSARMTDATPFASSISADPGRSFTHTVPRLM